MADTQRGRGTTAGISFGSIWFMGWLFTLGYAGLAFGSGFWALFVWPFYLGRALAGG